MLSSGNAVSVCLVIPCYNHGPALLRTLQALTAGQFLSPFACILVDDGSDAQTAALLDALPDHLARADALKKRHAELNNRGRK